VPCLRAAPQPIDRKRLFLPRCAGYSTVITSISEPREVLSMSRAELAVRQTALVAALVAGAEAPEGIDAGHLAVARRALLHKRAGEVAVVWPLLAASVGHDWTATFAEWATGRPPQGSLRDGWDLARDLATGGKLGTLGQVELATREATTCYDGRTTPRRRRLPALRRVPGGVVVQLAGRVRRLASRHRIRPTPPNRYTSAETPTWMGSGRQREHDTTPGSSNSMPSKKRMIS
jgi:hypothetical protein